MTPGTGTEASPDVDARGQRCPLPVIWLARFAADLPAGRHVIVWATDPAAAADIPAWCRMRGHTVQATDAGEHTAYDVVLGSAPA